MCSDSFQLLGNAVEFRPGADCRARRGVCPLPKQEAGIARHAKARAAQVLQGVFGQNVKEIHDARAALDLGEHAPEHGTSCGKRSRRSLNTPQS